MSDKSDNNEEAKKLFGDYAHALNTEFRNDDGSVERLQETCAEIAQGLLSLGFMIFSQHVLTLRERTPTDDTVQTVISITYLLLLMPAELDSPSNVGAALAIARAQSTIFGPIIPASKPPSLSSQNEAWLHKILDPLT